MHCPACACRQRCTMCVCLRAASSTKLCKTACEIDITIQLGINRNICARNWRQNAPRPEPPCCNTLLCCATGRLLSGYDRPLLVEGGSSERGWRSESQAVIK